jgi:hypothetical protein
MKHYKTYYSFNFKWFKTIQYFATQFAQAKLRTACLGSLLLMLSASQGNPEYDSTRFI